MTLRLTLGFRSLAISDAARIAQCQTTLVTYVGISSFSSSLCSLTPLYATPANLTSSRSFSVLSRLDFHLDPTLFAMPLKKKRKIDPALVKKREDRIRDKITRALGRLGRYAEKLKPIDEYEIPRPLVKEREARIRVLEPLAFEESEKRAKLRREFDVYSRQLNIQDRRQILRVQASQKKALDELKAVSETLYLKAIETDETLLDLASPIVTFTPPIEGYEAPDGDHKDVTKTFEYDVDFITVLEANLSQAKPKWMVKQEMKEAMAALDDDDDDKKENKKKERVRYVSTPPPALNP